MLINLTFVKLSRSFLRWDRTKLYVDLSS